MITPNPFLKKPFTCEDCGHFSLANFQAEGAYRTLVFECKRCRHTWDHRHEVLSSLTLVGEPCGSCEHKAYEVVFIAHMITGDLSLNLRCNRCHTTTILDDESAGFILPAKDGGLGRKFR